MPSSLCRILGHAAILVATSLSAVSAQEGKGPPPPAVYVESVPLTDQKFTGSFTGKVVAAARVDLVARVDGFLLKQNFSEGQDVKAGDVLFEIEPDSYHAAQIQIEGQLEAAQAQKKAAEADAERKRILVNQGDVAQAQLDVSEANLGEVEGNIKALEGQLENAGLNLSYTQITSPIDGVTGLASIDVGNYVGPSSGTLVSVTQLDQMHVEFLIPTAEVLRYRSEREAEGEQASEAPTDVFLELPDGTQYAQIGKIDFVDSAVSGSTDAIRIRAVFPNPDRLLYHGELVDVRLEQDKAEPALTVQLQAVLRDLIGPYVFVIDDSNTASRVDVTTGGIMDGRIVILDGLSEGDRVVTDGMSKVQPGMVVDPAVRGETPAPASE